MTSDRQNSLLKIDFYFQNRKYYFILYFQNTFERYFVKYSYYKLSNSKPKTSFWRS